jgi:hypothetical protein
VPFQYHSNEPPLDGAALLLPHSLPSLRELRFECNATAAAIASLLGAAGPRLSRLVCSSATTTDAVAAMAVRDFPWLPSLESLDLYWPSQSSAGESPPWRQESGEQLVLALSRMPALNRLAPLGGEYDEIVVRLLALAEGGGLPQLVTLDLPWDSSLMSHGAQLLVAVWLKRQAKQAVEGAEGAVLWEISLIGDMLRRLLTERGGGSMHLKALLKMEDQIAAARKQLEGKYMGKK